MGILSCLFKSRDKLTNITNGSEYSFLMVGSTSGRRVDERQLCRLLLYIIVFEFYLRQWQVFRCMFILEQIVEQKSW